MLVDDPFRLATATAALLAYAGLCARSWRRARCARGGCSGGSGTPGPGDARRTGPTLIAYASQTGFAEALAHEAAQSLGQSGRSVRVAPLGSVRLEDLHTCAQLVVIASTCRKGDAPDNAQPFVETVMRRRARLDSLPFLLLALGDRRYREFCAFGRRLDDWLQASGASPIRERIEVDVADPSALDEWRHRLTSHLYAGRSEAPIDRSRVPVRQSFL